MLLWNGALSVCCIVLCLARLACAQGHRSRGYIPISAATIDVWARSLSSQLYATASEATRVDTLDKIYRPVRIEYYDPEEVIEVMKDRLEAFLARRRQLTEILKENLENSYDLFAEVNRDAINDLESDDFYRFVNSKTCLNRHYVDPLLINSSLLVDYKPNANFFNLPVNIEKSAVHVPTPVYSREPELLSEIIWTESLDDIFKARRSREFFAASWQYFCSKRGFMRFYPGSPWFYDDPNTCLDMFDCRTSEWYIDAATQPKNIVILLDVSGSMLGQRFEIAKQTIEMIMETLTENDFFNIVSFSEEPRFVLPCFRGRLVQATIRNKKLLRAKLDNVTCEGIANYPAALTMAFEVILEAERVQVSAGCHSAIMLVTDGASDTHEDIFQQYNADKSIRFFSYLIGDDVTDFREVKWMACYNRGYFAHISNLADVQEKVQAYIGVMSRPEVAQNRTDPIWTGAYFDQLGRVLVVTAASPVIANDSFRGVVGSSALITELQQMAPSYMLGANAYSFIVDNNGYVVHHPQLRLLHMGRPKPHYNSMDVMELEVLADNFIENDTLSMPVDYDNQLRRHLADGVSSKSFGSKITQKVILALDGLNGMRRVYTQKNVYYHRGVKNTLMTLALAVPEESRYRIVNDQQYQPLHRSIDFTWLEGRNWRLHPDWHYCRFNDSDVSVSKEQAFVEYLRQYVATGHLPRNCALYEYLIRRVLFDLRLTSGMEHLWMQQTVDERKGIVAAYLVTHSGLSRLHVFPLADVSPEPWIDANDTETASKETGLPYAPFAGRSPRGLDEVFYKRAMQFPNGEFVFDIRPNDLFYVRNSSALYAYAKSGTTVLVSGFRSIYARDDQGNMAPAGAVGFDMLYASVEEMISNASQRLCRPNGSVRCFLLDEHGYIIYASVPDTPDESAYYLGAFFGALSLEHTVNGAVERFLMKRLVEKYIYRELVYVDFQELCLNLNLYSSAERLMTPFFFIGKIVFLLARTLIRLFLEFNPFTLLLAILRPTLPYTPTFDDIHEGLPCDKASSFYLLDREFRGPVVLAEGKQLCSSALPGDTYARVSSCNVYAYATRVPRTNLVLLVYNTEGSQCNADLCKSYFSGQSVHWGFELVVNASDKVTHPSSCMLMSRYRRVPGQCQRIEDDDYQAPCSSFAPNCNLLLLTFLLSLVLVLLI